MLTPEQNGNPESETERSQIIIALLEETLNSLKNS